MNKDKSTFVDKVILSTMVFCIFIIIHLIREQNANRILIESRERIGVRKGIELVESKIWNHMIAISWSTNIVEKENQFNPEIIQSIKENTKQIKWQIDQLKRLED